MDYKEFFKQYGLKNTPQRNAVLEVLKNSTQPLDAQQLFDEAKGYYAKINLSTIYRILEIFIEKGIAAKTISAQDNKPIYSLLQHTGAHRHTLTCLKCRQEVDLTLCPVSQYKHSIEKQTDFVVTEHEVSLYGYCKKCREEENNEK